MTPVVVASEDATGRSDTRTIDCPCGHRLEAESDEELFRLAREHVDRDHPEMQRTDEQIWERVRRDAYDAES
jgi:predicted small metal-binding protein